MNWKCSNSRSNRMADLRCPGKTVCKHLNLTRIEVVFTVRPTELKSYSVRFLSISVMPIYFCGSIVWQTCGARVKPYAK